MYKSPHFIMVLFYIEVGVGSGGNVNLIVVLAQSVEEKQLKIEIIHYFRAQSWT